MTSFSPRKPLLIAASLALTIALFSPVSSRLLAGQQPAGQPASAESVEENTIFDKSEFSAWISDSIIPATADKDVTVLVGDTGSGKSTLINTMLGVIYDFNHAGNLTPKNRFDEHIDTKDEQIAVTSEIKVSATRNGGVYHRESDGQVFVDTAGLSDTTGEAAIAYGRNVISTVLRVAKSVKIMIVVDYSAMMASRGKGLRDLAANLDAFFTNQNFMKDDAKGQSQQRHRSEDSDFDLTGEDMNALLMEGGIFSRFAFAFNNAEKSKRVGRQIETVQLTAEQVADELKDMLRDEKGSWVPTLSIKKKEEKRLTIQFLNALIDAAADRRLTTCHFDGTRATEVQLNDMTERIDPIERENLQKLVDGRKTHDFDVQKMMSTLILSENENLDSKDDITFLQGHLSDLETFVKHLKSNKTTEANYESVKESKIRELEEKLDQNAAEKANEEADILRLSTSTTPTLVEKDQIRKDWRFWVNARDSYSKKIPNIPTEPTLTSVGDCTYYVTNRKWEDNKFSADFCSSLWRGLRVDVSWYKEERHHDSTILIVKQKTDKVAVHEKLERSYTEQIAQLKTIDNFTNLLAFLTKGEDALKQSMRSAAQLFKKEEDFHVAHGTGSQYSPIAIRARLHRMALLIDVWNNYDLFSSSGAPAVVKDPLSNFLKLMTDIKRKDEEIKKFATKRILTDVWQYVGLFEDFKADVCHGHDSTTMVADEMKKFESSTDAELRAFCHDLGECVGDDYDRDITRC